MTMNQWFRKESRDPWGLEREHRPGNAMPNEVDQVFQPDSSYEYAEEAEGMRASEERLTGSRLFLFAAIGVLIWIGLYYVIW